MESVDFYNNLIYQCDRNIRKIDISNCAFISCELVSFILCSGLPLDYIVLTMCVEAIIFKSVVYSKYGSKFRNYEIRNDCLEKKKKILELRR